MVNKMLSRNYILKNEVIVTGDFNMNLLEFKENEKISIFLNILCLAIV